MAKREKYKIYLAGPMTGCNRTQQTRWREEVKNEKEYAGQFEFIDPARRLSDRYLGKGADPLGIVEADLQDIESADGMLVNMWRESIGASIGMVHAYRLGLPVAVADPNHLESGMIEFYADVREDDPREAMRKLRDRFLGVKRWRVPKAVDGEAEPFNRRRLVASIGGACKRAGKDDVVFPCIILRRTMNVLRHREIGNQITTSTINEAVQRTLEYLGKSDVHKNVVEGVLEEWNKGDDVEKRVLVTRRVAGDSDANRFADVGSQPAGDASIRISSGKHPTIWGNRIRALGDIPSRDARTFFQTIMNVPGVTEIHLGKFTSKEPRVSVCGFVFSSPQHRGLDGKFFDKWEAAQRPARRQNFKVYVQFEATKHGVLAQCEESLRAAGLWDERKGGPNPPPE